MSKPVYRLMDGKGRVLIPKAMRDAAKMDYGDIVCLGMTDGKITVRKVHVIEVGDQSPEAILTEQNSEECWQILNWGRSIW